MKHPEMVNKERKTTFNNTRDRYWYRWMGLYTSGLMAVLLLIYAVHSGSMAVVVTVVASLFVVGLAMTAWLAQQRALDETKRDAPEADASTSTVN